MVLGGVLTLDVPIEIEAGVVLLPLVGNGGMGAGAARLCGAGGEVPFCPPTGICSGEAMDADSGASDTGAGLAMALWGAASDAEEGVEASGAASDADEGAAAEMDGETGEGAGARAVGAWICPSEIWEMKLEGGVWAIVWRGRRRMRVRWMRVRRGWVRRGRGIVCGVVGGVWWRGGRGG